MGVEKTRPGSSHPPRKDRPPPPPAKKMVVKVAVRKLPLIQSSPASYSGLAELRGKEGDA